MAELTFPEDRAIYDYQLDNIVFEAADGLQRVRCIIGAKALQNHFGAQGRSQQQLMAAFRRGIQPIREAASRKYATQGAEVGELMLTSRDLEGGNTALDRQLAKHLSLSTPKR